MHYRKVQRILQYNKPNKLLSPEKFAHDVMLLFFPFRDEKQLLSAYPPMHQTKLQEQGVQDVVNRDKMKFVPSCDLYYQAFSQFNESSINNQDPYGQIEKDETPGAEYPNENDSEHTETNKTSAIPNFIPQILPDDEITNGMYSLSSKQSQSTTWFIHKLKIV